MSSESKKTKKKNKRTKKIGESKQKKIIRSK